MKRQNKINDEDYLEESSTKIDSLRLYMKECRKEELLSDDEESRITELIESGDYKAYERIILANLRLVTIAAYRHKDSGIDLDDLIQEGNVALIEAVHTFNSSMGNRFSTYAMSVIERTITEYIENNRKIVRIPGAAGSDISRFINEESRLEEATGHEPDDKQISEALGWNVRKVATLRMWIRPVLSLSDTLKDDTETTLEDTIEDEKSLTAYESIDNEDIMHALFEALISLPVKEQKVVKMRFGLDGNGVRKLSDIAKEYGVTKERIRQIEKEALSSLKSALIDMGIEDFCA